MSESSEGLSSPQDQDQKPQIDQHAEIIIPNQKPESRLSKTLSGWMAMARNGYRVWRMGGHKPVQPGQVTARLESLKNQFDNAQPFDLKNSSESGNKK